MVFSHLDPINERLGWSCLLQDRESRSRKSRHRVKTPDNDDNDLPEMPLFPVCRLLLTLVLGGAVLAVGLPPVRVRLFQLVPSHTVLCNVPYFDHWDLAVEQSAAGDPFYLSAHCLLFAMAAYLAPMFPILHRNKRVQNLICF